MHATDLAPKSTHNPNKIKFDNSRTLTPLDMELECRLKAFHVRLHADWWRNMGLQDHFLGPHMFLNHSHVELLCHLGDSGLLATIDDLRNNFKWIWMDEHGEELLKIIHDVYGQSLLTVANMTSTVTKDSGISEPALSSSSIISTPTNAPSTPKALAKP